MRGEIDSTAKAGYEQQRPNRSFVKFCCCFDGSFDEICGGWRFVCKNINVRNVFSSVLRFERFRIKNVLVNSGSGRAVQRLTQQSFSNQNPPKPIPSEPGAILKNPEQIWKYIFVTNICVKNFRTTKPRKTSTNDRPTKTISKLKLFPTNDRSHSAMSKKVECVSQVHCCGSNFNDKRIYGFVIF